MIVFIGHCGKCAEKIVDVAEACQAMDVVYHARCFVCVSCGKQNENDSTVAQSLAHYSLHLPCILLENTPTQTQTTSHSHFVSICVYFVLSAEVARKLGSISCF